MKEETKKKEVIAMLGVIPFKFLFVSIFYNLCRVCPSEIHNSISDPFSQVLRI